jgi:hypothetical protein
MRMLINLYMQGSYTSIIVSALDQLQLVPSGDDSGPHRTSTVLKFSVIYIRVPLHQLVIMEARRRFEHGKVCLGFIR